MSKINSIQSWHRVCFSQGLHDVLGTRYVRDILASSPEDARILMSCELRQGEFAEPYVVHYAYKL